jgi:hypothetical protein
MITKKPKIIFSCSLLKMFVGNVGLDFNGSCSFSRRLRKTLLFMAYPARTNRDFREQGKKRGKRCIVEGTVQAAVLACDGGHVTRKHRSLK